MTRLGFQQAPDTSDPIEDALKELVSTQRSRETVFINLPMFFPSGSAATVAVSKTRDGYRVSDHGFAYRELEAIGAERSFSRTAGAFMEAASVEKDRRQIFVIVPSDEIGRAISDVGTASWRVVNKVYDDRREAEDEIILEDDLTAKLISLFGEPRVKVGQKPRGSSGTEWNVSAIVETDDKKVIFQAVSSHAGSVYRANSAFHDLASIKNAPRLVAVVNSFEALGSRLGVLAQAGKVIEKSETPDAFIRAAS